GRQYSNSGGYDDIRSGNIASDGSISGWATTGHSGLPGGSDHYQASAVLDGNRVYITGGTNVATTYDNVYMGTIDVGTGALTFSETPVSTRPEEVRASWLTITNGRLYSFGGLTGASVPTKSTYS